jgi:hypothetical protein
VLNQILESKGRQKEWLSEGPDGLYLYKIKAVKFRVQIHDTPRHICEYGVDMDAD